MTTTATRAQPARARAALGVLLGALAATSVFAFGAYALLPCALLLAARRLRIFSAAFLATGLLCLIGAVLGYNPLLNIARERALDKLEAALGQRPAYRSFKGSAVMGEFSFIGLSANVPDVGGTLVIDELDVRMSPTLLWPGVPRVVARGLKLELSPRDDGLKKWAARISEGDGTAFEAEFSEVWLVIKGPMVSASAYAPKVSARSENGDTRLTAAPQWVELTVNRQAHRLSLLGTVNISRGSRGFGLNTDLHFIQEQAGRGLIRGELGPQFSDSGLRITLDQFKIAPIWDRYATWSQFSGEGQGIIDVAGDFARLKLKPRLNFSNLDYFHTTAMKLDRSRRFALPLAAISGELHVLAGRDFEFVNIQAKAEDCPLATDPAIKARGPVKVLLNGVWPDLTGTIEAAVREGSVTGPLEFTRTGRPLGDYEPNSVPLIELLPSFNVNLNLQIEKLTLDCDPLYGRLAGELSGTLVKKPDEPFVSVRLQGELPLLDGRFEFCAAKGSAAGKLIFSPLAPPREASLRGVLLGKAGDTALDVEVTGRLSAPGLIFKRVAMRPEELGKVVGGLDDPRLSAALRAERVAKISRMCGVFAATRGNPFEVAALGEIFLDFRAGD